MYKRQWSVNSIKQAIIYRYHNHHITMTIYIDTGGRTLGEMRQKMVTHLRRHNMYINHHRDNMSILNRTLLGWYSGTHHPDAINQEDLHYQLNRDLKQQFNSNPTKYTDLLEHTPDFNPADWSPDTDFPLVTTSIIKVNWFQNPQKQWKTRAVSLYGISTFTVFLKHLLTDLEQTNNPNKISFVDQSMQHGNKETQAEFGKALFQHQSYLHNHEITHIRNLSKPDMNAIKHVLTGTTGVTSIHRQLTVPGSWLLVTRKDISISNLKKIDRHLLDHHLIKPLRQRPR